MKKPVLLMLHLVVQWLGLASAANYPLVTFSTDWVTPEKYNSFIASVRAALVSTTKEKSNGIPVLISKDDPHAIETYLNVTLTNKAGQSVSLKMDVTGAYFTAYEAGKYSCLISSATCYSDPFSSSVAKQLEESTAAAGDGGLGLGAATWRAKDLDEAISSLFLFAAGKATEQSFRRGVATCEMMISSAAKFRYIQRRLSAGMWDGAGNGVSNDPSLNGLQARWPTLSSSVQQSNQGAFPAPVTVDRSNGKPLRVDNVRRAVPLVSFLEHDKCGKKAASSSSSSRSLQLPMVIRSVVQEAAAEMAACKLAEPTMHIVGAEGKCVDVPHSSYVKGAQVILWPCRSNDYDDMNQLWTLKSDGTIRINNGRMCLRASSASAGDRVVIDNCWTARRDHAVWDVRADGTIALRSDGGLVLAATSTVDRTGLTLERDGGGTGQAWTPTNDTAPLVTTVLGYRDLYLQVNAAGAVVLAAPCGGAAAEWALYPDGSIRRGSARQQCLAPDAAGRVVACACSVAGASRQRWVFRNDGTVFNSGAGKVMDVRPRLGALPGCVSQGVAEWEVVVSEPAPGSPTQEWVIML